MTIERTKLDAIGFGKQDSGGGLKWGTPPTFAATGPGHLSGFTTVCAALMAWGATDDDFVGWILEVVHCANGPAGEYGAGHRVRILEYDHTSGFLTHEALPWQTDDGDIFRLLIPPHGWWSDDTGGSAVLVQDADRDEANDYWQGSAEEGGPYTHVLHADNIAATTQVLATDFDQATGNLTVANMGANTALADLIELVQWLEVMGGPLTFEQPRLARESIVGGMGQLRGVAAPVVVSGQHEVPFAGPGVGRVGSKAGINLPLESVLIADDASADCTVDAGATVDSIPLSAGAGVEGRCYLTPEGDAFFAAVGATPVTPNPSLRTAPATAGVIKGLRRYTPPDFSDPVYACWARQWLGRGVLEDLWGLRPAVTIAAERGQFLKFSLNWQGVTGYRRHLDDTGTAYARSIYPKLPTVTPRAVSHVRVVLDAVELEARMVNIDLGLQLVPRINEAAPDMIEAIDVRAADPTITVDLFLDDDEKAALRKYREGRACRFFVQVNRTGGDPGVVALWIHEAEITSAPIGDDTGARTVQLQLAARHDPSRDADWPRWCLAIG